MALTLGTAKQDHKQGGLVEYKIPVTFDNSYATGGETLDISSYVSSYTDLEISVDAGGYVVQHDGGTVSAGVLQVFEAGADGAALDEVANATDLSTQTVVVTVTGVAA